MYLTDYIINKKAYLSTNFNIDAKYVYVGYHEYHELKSYENNIHNIIDNVVDKERCCGLKLIKVDKLNHLNVC
jgi:hypothetical protein